MNSLSSLLDWLSEFLARRKGLLPLVGLILVVLNFVLQLFSNGWLVEYNCFLHLGLVFTIVGFLLARAL